MRSSLRSPLGQAAVLAALVLGSTPACREAPRAAARAGAEGVSARSLLAAPAAELDRPLWCEPGSRVTIAATGSGALHVALEEEEGGTTTLLDVDLASELDGGPLRTSLPVPGTLPRAVRLRCAATGGARITAARLDVPDPASGERSLTGSLAGSLSGRDVVLVVCDSLAAAHVSSYGNERDTTPTVDALAAAGARFETCSSQTAWTLPSVASLFTSLEQERHGVLRNTERLPAEPGTLAEAFRDAGYRTVGLIQNGTVWRQTGLDRGFDHYLVFGRDEEATEHVFARCRQVLRGAGDGRPTFLYVHLLAPHMPYDPPAAFRGRYGGGYAGDVVGSIADCAALDAAGHAPDHPDVVHLRALYDEYLRWIDARLAELVALAHAPERRALLVFTADHGEAFLQHGAQGHNVQVYEEMVRVPLVLAAPGEPWSDGRTLSEPASLLDLFPTLVDLCGLTPPRHAVGGRSLVPALAGAVRARRPLCLSSRYETDGGPAQEAVRAGRYKWLRETASGRERLFDLARDPGEERDLAAELPITRAALAAVFAEFHDEAQRERESRGPVESRALSPEMRDHLRSIGYADDE